MLEALSATSHARQALVKLTVARYVLPKRINDVSEALHELFNFDLDVRLDRATLQASRHLPLGASPKQRQVEPSCCCRCQQRCLPPRAQDSNAFRERYVYVEETDLVLRKHESSLRLLYDRYAIGKGGEVDSLTNMTSSKWLG